MGDFQKLIISANKLTLPDGRILGRFYPDLREWELLIWYKGRYMGSKYVPILDEMKIIHEAMLNGCWVDCLECEDARELYIKGGYHG